MKTIREYAEENGITYEAVRKQIRKYESELEGHIKKEKHGTILDESAIAFLDARRMQDPVVVYDSSNDQERLQKENEDLRKKLISVQETLIQLQPMLLERNSALAMVESSNKAAEQTKAELGEQITYLRGLVDQREEDIRKLQEQLHQSDLEKAGKEKDLQAAEKELTEIRNRGFLERLFNL